MKKQIQKLFNNSGFTLAETLMTVMIVLLASSVIAAGIPAAANAYTKAVDAANAQVLLSTTVNALRSELSTAWGVDINASANEVTFYSSKTGAKTKLSLGTDNIMVFDYMQYGGTGGQSDADGNTSSAVELVSEELREGKFVVAYSMTNPQPSDKAVYFNNVTVKDKDDNTIAESGKLTIQLLKKDFIIPEIVSTVP